MILRQKNFQQGRDGLPSLPRGCSVFVRLARRASSVDHVSRLTFHSPETF
jgi:hypothetical protein